MKRHRHHLLTSLGFLVASVVLALAQPIYPNGYIPLYSDCATRVIIPNVACHDNTNLYLGNSTGTARIQMNAHGGSIEFAAEDAAATTGYLIVTSSRATTAENTAVTAATTSYALMPIAATLTRLYCTSSAAAHAGATFTYAITIGGTPTAITCQITDATTSCTGTGSVALSQFSALGVQKVDTAVTDGTQTQRCVVSWTT